MSYDPKCETLARYFCSDEPGLRANPDAEFEIREMAQAIQDAAERWLEVFEVRRIARRTGRAVGGVRRGRYVEHIDGDLLNNDPANLRITTRSQNRR